MLNFFLVVFFVPALVGMEPKKPMPAGTIVSLSSLSSLRPIAGSGYDTDDDGFIPSDSDKDDNEADGEGDDAKRWRKLEPRVGDNPADKEGDDNDYEGDDQENQAPTQTLDDHVDDEIVTLVGVLDAPVPAQVEVAAAIFLPPLLPTAGKVEAPAGQFLASAAPHSFHVPCPVASIFSGFGLSPIARDKFHVSETERVIDLNYLIMLRNVVSYYPEKLSTESPEAHTARLQVHAAELATRPEFLRLYADFDDQMTKFARITQAQHEACAWIGKKPAPEFYALHPEDEEKFITYVQKVTVPAKSRLLLIGDIHGGYHTLISMFEDLRNKKIIDNNLNFLDPNLYCFFLGDIGDRGFFSVESWYFIMRLKNANPERVVLVRGNHEEKFQNLTNGFAYEARSKIASCISKLYGLYNLLPVACFLNKHALLCHGGLDYCCDARALCAHASTFACQMITPDNYNPHVFFSQFSDELLGDVTDAIISATCDQALSMINNVLIDTRPKVIECQALVNQIQSSGVTFNIDDDNKVLEEAIDRFNGWVEDFTNDTVNLDISFNGLLRTLQYITSITKNYEVPEDSIICQCESACESLSKIPDENYNNCKAQMAQLGDPASIAIIKPTLIRLLKTAQRPEHFHDSKLPSIMFMESINGARAGILQEFFVSRIAETPLTDLCQCNYAWCDFDTEAKGPALGLQDEYRYSFGMALSHAIMKHQALHVVFRAHQHHGAMRDLLDKHRGFVELWDKSTGDIVSVKRDAVYTLDVAYASRMRCGRGDGKPYDTITELTIEDPKDIRTWVLRKFNVLPVLSLPSVPEDVPVAGVVTASASGITVRGRESKAPAKA